MYSVDDIKVGQFYDYTGSDNYTPEYMGLTLKAMCQTDQSRFMFLVVRANKWTQVSQKVEAHHNNVSRSTRCKVLNS